MRRLQQTACCFQDGQGAASARRVMTAERGARTRRLLYSPHVKYNRGQLLVKSSAHLPNRRRCENAVRLPLQLFVVQLLISRAYGQGCPTYCPPNPCPACNSVFTPCDSTYWENLFVAAGVTGAALCDYRSNLGLQGMEKPVWFYQCVSTCVGHGSFSETCSQASNVCAGGSNYGSGSAQVAAVLAAVSNGGTHASCPAGAPPQTTRHPQWQWRRF